MTAIKNPQWTQLEQWYSFKFVVRKYGSGDKTYGRTLLHDTGGKVMRIYVTDRYPEHYYRKLQAFFLSKFVWDNLLDKNVNGIFIRYHGTKGIIWYTASMEVWAAKKISHSDEKTNESQIGLSRYDMQEIREQI